MPPRPHNAICLIVDGLHAGYLGAYGNTWLSTPAWDRLASEAALFDFAFVDTPNLTKIHRSYWSGVHAGCRDNIPGGISPSLADRLESAGVDAVLITDEGQVARHELARGFSDVLHIEGIAPETASSTLAASIEETALAQFFAQISARIEQLSEPFLLWTHCGSLGRVWDAPLTLRHALLEEELDDEDPPAQFRALLETTPPCRMLPDDFDPDELFALRRAYAAQVQVLDACLGAMLESIDEAGLTKSTLLVATGARGFPLAEHRRLGWCDGELHEELIHVPWMMRFPDSLGASQRIQALVQPPDLAMTLASWFDLPRVSLNNSIGLGRDLVPLIRGEVETFRDRILIVGDDGSRALRTPAWLLRKPAPPATGLSSITTAPAELFAKPDDRWETNEVHNRCPEVAAELEERLNELADSQDSSASVGLTPLSESALKGVS